MDPIIVETIGVNEKREKIGKEIAFLSEFDNQINQFEKTVPRITFLKNEIDKLPKPVLIHPLRPNNSSVLNLRPESTPQTLK